MIKTDQRPLYLQVIDRIKEDIDKKVYEEGEKLPSEFELSKQLGVSRATLREALRILEEEGVVIRRHGVGTFVHSKPLFTAGIEEMYSVTDMIIQANMTPGTIFLSSSVQPATEEDRRKFAQEDLDEIMEIERVRTADGTPVVYCLDQIPNQLVENHSIHETKSIFRFLEEIGRTITHAVTYIEPIGYHEHVSEILECDPESSLLLLKQMHYDQLEQPLLYSLNYFRADKFKFHVVRKRVKA
ncbi:GntR family transcriptional regulator [Alkalihalobacillus oceani]|uniref:GntR family transcriptional regulator n=1 Tax=Halalkalibacter oceani TaxID=1653776 RepID=UPI00203B8044|nr:GntR family transcriptional regulator [Halalkalibacter oceani]MCM3759509.1 GntR family transcriptional regulator [Halalkalibacter oceani]